MYREKAIKQLTGMLIFGDNPSGEIFYVDADKLPKGGQNFHRILFNDKGETKTLLQLIKEKNTQQGKPPATRADLRHGRRAQRTVLRPEQARRHHPPAGALTGRARGAHFRMTLPRTIARVLGVMLLGLLSAASAQSQNAVDAALSFYANGGAYCFRVAPPGTALSDETEWTVMVLTAASNHRNTYRIRSVDPGDTGLSGSGLLTAGRLANDVWKFDGTRSDFFERFAGGD